MDGHISVISTLATICTAGALVLTYLYLHKKTNGSVLQVDRPAEIAAEHSGQKYPNGCQALLQDGRSSTIVAFNADTKQYQVQRDGQSEWVSENQVMAPSVQDLFVYPIKSCGGIRLDTAQVTRKGIQNDRSWMFVTSKGQMLTQRRLPKMSLIRPKLIPDVVHPQALVLTAEGMEDLHVPIVREGEDVPEMEVRVWKDTLPAIDQGDAAGDWMDQFLQNKFDKVRLVRVKDSHNRWTAPKYAPGHATGFADGFPFLLAQQSSLDRLNESLEEKIPMNRFRPNIVLAYSSPFADEEWSCVKIGDFAFRNVKPCSRCTVPTVDQDKGVRHARQEPRRTLRSERNGQVLGFIDGQAEECYFGSNMITETEGELRVGTTCQVLTRKTKVYA